MTMSNQVSAFVSSGLFVMIAAAMQLTKSLLVASPAMTVLAGFLGSLCFLFLITAISNTQMCLFGSQFQSKLTEIFIALALSMLACSLVHRVAVTTCFIFSIMTLAILCRLSDRVYGGSQVSSSAQYSADKPSSQPASGKKRR